MAHLEHGCEPIGTPKSTHRNPRPRPHRNLPGVQTRCMKRRRSSTRSRGGAVMRCDPCPCRRDQDTDTHRGTIAEEGGQAAVYVPRRNNRADALIEDLQPPGREIRVCCGSCPVVPRVTAPRGDQLLCLVQDSHRAGWGCSLYWKDPPPPVLTVTQPRLECPSIGTGSPRGQSHMVGSPGQGWRSAVMNAFISLVQDTFPEHLASAKCAPGPGHLLPISN